MLSEEKAPDKLEGGPGDGDKGKHIREQIQRNYEQVHQMMISGHPNYEQIITICDKTLDAFTPKDGPRLDNREDMQRLRRLLYGIRTAAERLQDRAVAEKAFKSLRLQVSGIVARDRNPTAIINNKVVPQGEFISPGQNVDHVIVEEILPGRVIVRFQGYKMELGMH